MTWMRATVAGLFCFGLMIASASAQNPPSFGLIDLGFTDFRAFDHAKAFHTWTYGGPLEQNPAFLKRLKATTNFWSSLGRCLGYKDVKSEAISQDSTAYSVTAQFEKGEVFFRFVVYQGLGHYTITTIRWATDPADFDKETRPRD